MYVSVINKLIFSAIINFEKYTYLINLGGKLHEINERKQYRLY